MKEILTIFGTVLGGTVVLSCGIVGVGYLLASTQCENVATLMERPYSYALLQGCMIQTKSGQWIPLENIKEVEP